jgi:tRNA nucleotidyltransferase (CCA-adding enzyme)
MNRSMNTYLVGGAVRDRLLGLPVNERDWVVTGATPEDMLAAGYRPVGQDFPVFLDPATGEEYALARTERKSGRGYGGFVFHTSPDVSLEQDLLRRDLTVNAIAQMPDGTLVDPYGGQRDLQARVLRHVSLAFAEDPLRVLRVARFAARYADLGFVIAPETLDLMRALAASGELRDLTAERRWKEISRALMEARPAVFFQTLVRCTALEELFPELVGLFAQDSPMPAFPSRYEFQLAVLEQAVQAALPLPCRWAALLQGFADHAEGCDAGLVAVKALNQHTRVPRDCAELAQSCCAHLADFRQAAALPAQTLANLFRALDVYRRPDRFELFLSTCEADWQVTEPSRAGENTSYLRKTADIARQIPIQPLLERGLKGGELGQALEQARQAALQLYRDDLARH